MVLKTLYLRDVYDKCWAPEIKQANYSQLEMNANCEIAQSSLNISFKTLSIYMKEVEDSC
jgi:hypothetical protein